MVRLFWALACACVLALSATEAGAEPPAVSDYGKLPAVENVLLSPSGADYAMITVDGEHRKLIVATTDSAVIYSADGGDTKVRSIEWAGEDHVLVVAANTVPLGETFVLDKVEILSVASINIRTGHVLPVFRDTANLAPIVFGYYGTAQSGGHQYGFFGGIPRMGSGKHSVYLTRDFADLYRVDLDDGDLTLAAKGSKTSDGWLIGPDGSVVAASFYDERSGDWSIHRGADGPVLAKGNSRFGGVSLTGLGRDAGKIVVGVPAGWGDTDTQISLANGAPSEIENGADIDELLFDRKTGLWSGYVKVGDLAEPHMFSPSAEAGLAALHKAFPNRSIRLSSSSDDFNLLVVFTSGAGDSGTYWLVDRVKHRADPIGYQYPTVQAVDVGDIRMVTWKAADGLELHGVLSLPPNRPAADLPVVVMPHGGPWARDFPIFDWWAQAFASQGYAVFQPNYRGSTGYGEKFYESGIGEYGGKMQTDIADGLAALARQGVVNPKRACIVGASYGGYAALYGVTMLHGLYRCSVSVAGVSDLTEFLHYITNETGDNSTDHRFLRSFIGDEHLDQISPMTQADQADAPILLIHGKDDTRVPISQSERMRRALRDAGKSVELIELPGEDHLLSREETRVSTVDASVAFVEKYNPPDPAPPAMAAAK